MILNGKQELVKFIDTISDFMDWNSLLHSVCLRSLYI
jgi:hypothetical protein